jgi:hypothetical protein
MNGSDPVIVRPVLIYELNKSKGHKYVNQFKEQDEQLLGQIHSLNEYIRHLNSRTEKISPNSTPAFVSDFHC